MGQRWLDGYSAAIEIYLLIDGKRYSVAQIGGGSLIMRDEVKIPPSTNATLIIKIDGHEERECVILTDGVEQYGEPVKFF